MIVYENHCMDCAVPGYPCLGRSCPHRHVLICQCDKCGDESIKAYEINGEHYCEDCAKAYIRDEFYSLTLSEQAEILGIELREVDDEYE